MRGPSLIPHSPGNATSFQVVGRQLHEDLVARHDPDEVHPHLAADVREHRVPVLELDLEHRVWKGVRNGPPHFDHLFVPRLDRYAEALADRWVGVSARRLVVRHLRLLVHRPTDSVTDVVLDDAEALRAYVLLDRGADVADPTAHLGVGDTDAEGFFGDPHEALRLGRDLPDRERDRRVGVPPVDDRAGIDAHDVAFPQLPLRRGDAMDDLFVDRGADRPRKSRWDLALDRMPVIAEEGAGGVRPSEHLGGDAIELRGRDPRANRRATRLEHGRDDPTGLAH